MRISQSAALPPTTLDLLPGPLLAAISAPIYLLVGSLTLTLPVPPGSLAPVWPANALLLAMLARLDRRKWLWVLGGAALACVAVNRIESLPAAASCCYTAGNLLEALLAAVILTRFGTGRIEFTSLRPILRLVLAAVPGSALVAALVAVATHYLAGDPDLFGFWRSWALSNCLAMLLFVPLVLNFPFPLRNQWPRIVMVETLCLFIAFTVLCHLIFDHRMAREAYLTSRPLLTTFPFLLWAAIRTNLFTVSVMAIECAAFSFIATVHGNGPFAASEPNLVQAIVMVQLALLAWPVCGYIIAAVIEENRRALQALLEANEFNNHIISNVQDGIIVIDRQMRYRVWSPVMERLSGMPAADVLGKTPMELFPFLREVGLLAMLERAMTGEIISSPDFPYDVPQTGRKGWSWQLMGPLRSAQGKIIGVITTVRDITQRKEFQQALLEANEFNNQIISNVQDGIIVMDLQLRYRVWSPGMERMRGLMAAEVLGKTPMELFPFLQEAGVVDMLERARAGETISTPDFAYEVPQTGRKGWNWGIMGPLRSADGQITGVIVTVRDITDRIQMQELAIQSEKMLSIGGLAAGMAHELNNPLAVMVQNAEVILQRISKDSPQNRVGAELAGTSLQAIQAYMNDREILQMLQGIHRSGERAANIVKSMLAFSRPRSATISTHRLDELIDQAIELMHSDYELMKRYHQSRVEMIREFDDTLGPVPCHGSEVQQVLLNLFSNAVHACAAVLPDAATPRIVVRTLRETNHATITVEDNGIGMPESVRRRVFEPFFTTKSPGEGTGLGLFLSYFIITHHHSGTMRVNPNPAGGTCFEISLPLDARKPAPLELKQN